MNVLIVVHQFLPDHFSGTETLALSVARRLRELGAQVGIFTAYPPSDSSQSIESDEYDVEGIPVHRFFAGSDASGAVPLAELEYFNPRANAHFREVLARIKPDIVHFFHFYRMGVGLIDAATERGTPAFFTPTDYWAVCPTMTLTLADGTPCAGPLPNAGNCIKHLASAHQVTARTTLVNAIPEGIFEWGARCLMGSWAPRGWVPHNVRALARRRDFILQRMGTLTGIFAPTQAMVRLFEAQGIDPERIIESAFGIDLKLPADEPGRRSHDDGLVIGFIGTLKALKGCLVLLEAVEALPPGRVKVVVYGRDSDDPSYFELVRSKAESLPFVTLAGTFPGEDIGRVLSKIDVLVVPSLWDENTPLVVLNALAARCPVIGSDVEGINAVIRHEYNGLLFPRGDWRALQRLLERVLEDSELLGALKANCRPPRSTEDYVATLIEYYESTTVRVTHAGSPSGD